VWPREDRDFTPWLLSNQDRLGDVLGIDVELSQAEHPVGGFLLDLIGKDLTNNATLIVENQLAGTDHGHLGQIMTYAAGTGASTIVWIATSFREEHRQALEWLNEITADEARFFGLRVKVVRIADSLPAPLFEIVVGPNDWQKRVRAVTAPARAGGKAEYYRQFWTRFIERVRVEHPQWTRATKPGDANWLSMPSPVAGANISASFAAGGRLRHELYIDCGDAEVNAETFSRLASKRAMLEQSYGRRLEFEELPARRACRIAEYRPGDVSDTDKHEEFIDWFFDAGERLRRALDAIQS
jgi:hypothetical protein